VSAALDRTFAALADPVRRRVVEELRQRPCRAGELAQILEISAPAMSRHLRVLRQSGLVDEHSPEEDARVRVYHLRPEAFHDLGQWLEHVQGLWSTQLEAFAAFVEGSAGIDSRRGDESAETTRDGSGKEQSAEDRARSDPGSLS
jgi:DNA-binding transcriptional ArsR family regulator